MDADLQGRHALAILGASTAAFEMAEHLRAHGTEVVAMVPPPGKGGSVMMRRAQSAGLRMLDPGCSINDPETVSRLHGLGCDLLVNWGHEERLRADVLAAASLGVINLHPGAIPGARGREPVFAALVNGWHEIVQTVHLMVEVYDNGPIIAARRIAIDDEPYRDTVEERLRVGAVGFYADAIDAVLAGSRGMAPAGPSRYFPALRAEDDVIDWREDVAEILRRVRALSPFMPGRAWQPESAEGLSVWRAEKAASSDEKGIPGVILASSPAGVEVRAADGIVRLTEWQLGVDASGDPRRLPVGARLICPPDANATHLRRHSCEPPPLHAG